jgi:hypothetical protein
MLHQALFMLVTQVSLPVTFKAQMVAGLTLLRRSACMFPDLLACIH